MAISSPIPIDISVNNVWTTAWSENENDTAMEQDVGLESSFITDMYVVIGTVGMTGNAFVLFVILNIKSMRSKLSNVFIINQSAIDFGVALLLVASSGVDGANVPAAFSGIGSTIYCKFWATKFGLWGLLVSSTFNLLALTVERYMEILHPIRHKITFTKQRAAVVIAGVWILGPAYNAAYMVPTSFIDEDGLCQTYVAWPSAGVQRGFGLFCIIIQFFIPLIILVLCYGKIAYFLAKASTKGSKPTGDGSNSEEKPTVKDEKFERARKNTIKTLIIVAFTFVFCWSWNQIYFTMMNLGYPPDYVSVFYHFTVLMVFVNCCINPFVYVLKFEQFQEGAKQIFCKRCMKNAVGDVQVTSSSSA